jgi:hypothetical protein
VRPNTQLSLDFAPPGDFGGMKVGEG